MEITIRKENRYTLCLADEHEAIRRARKSEARDKP